MTLFSSWRTALRIARREAARSKGRSALVVAMIAVPVLCLGFAAVSYDMFTLTGDEKANRLMGTADARVTWDLRVPIFQNVDGESYGVDGSSVVVRKPEQQPGPASETEVLAKFPSGTNALPMRRGGVSLRTATGEGDLNAVSVDANSPLTYGLVDVLQGRAPRTPDEVALTKEAVRRLGADIGATIVNTDGSHSYTVVGLVEFPNRFEEVVLFAPTAEQHPAGVQLDSYQWLLNTPSPVDWQQVLRLNQLGMLVASRAVLRNPPADSVVAAAANQVAPNTLAAGVLVGGLALLEIVLLAGPAFAVSARRRQRQLALVAANGGTPAHVRRIVLADGIVLGAVGAVVGVALGIGAAFAGRPYVEDLVAHQRAGGYRVFPVALITIAGLAVVIGVLAALFPAFIVARQNVVAALAGRRGIAKSKKRWLVLGLVMIVVALAITAAGALQVSTNVMLAGMIIGELGMVACTPTLVGLVARLGRVLPLMPRIALRDAARNRAAAAPAIAAVMAAVAGSVAIGLYLDSSHAQNVASYQALLPTGNAMVYIGQKEPGAAGPDVPAVLAAINESLPVAHAFETSQVACANEAAHPSVVCVLELRPVPEKQCPYLDILGTRQLTAGEAQAARKDIRCRDASQAMMYGAMSLGGLVVDDAATLAALTGTSGDDLARAAATLRSGGVLVPSDQYIKDGRATFTLNRFDQSAPLTNTFDNSSPLANEPPKPGPAISFPAYALTSGTRMAGAIISPGALATAKLGSTADQIIIATTRMPTQAEVDRLDKRLHPLHVNFYLEHGPSSDTSPMLWILAAAAATVALGATAIATGLAAADGRADLSTLAAVGASPRLRRGLSLSQSGIISGLGSILGATAGLGVAAAVLTALNQRYADIWPGPIPFPIAVPWVSLGVALLIVPLIAMGGAGLLTRSRLPIERRR